MTTRGTTGRHLGVPATPLSRDNPENLAHPTPTSTRMAPSTTPLTHQRGRPANRYPDTLGRIPLHRRGTSKTYERLEDLLREAGYKETRVFTPETDRHARSATEKQDGAAGNSVRGSVGAVVDFLAGLVSRGSSLARETAPLEENTAQPDLHAWPPPSPLAHAVHIKDNTTRRVPSGASLSHSGSSESIRRPALVDLSASTSQRGRVHQIVQRHQSAQGLPHHPHSYLGVHHHHRNRHHHQVNNHSAKSASTKPNQPNARAYLRHMASAPNIQPLSKRPSSSAVSLRSHALGREHRKGSRRTFILNDEGSVAQSDHEPQFRDENQHQVHPPLPRNWIESVAKALLSGVGAQAVAVASDAASTRTAKTSSTRKSYTLSDKSNGGERGRAPTKPPLLCVQVQDVKGRTSEGQVSRTKVMCRSTPTSRASSRVRSDAHHDHTMTRNSGKRKEGDRPRIHRGGKGRDARVVPSLARTRVENDDWMAPRQRYASGWGTEGSAQAYSQVMWSDDSEDEEEDEDDEGELGLDRLLVPARRQHSIQSLRKHLHRHPSQLFGGRPKSPASGRTSPFRGASTRGDWGDASWGTSRGREWLTTEGEESEDGYGYVFSGTEVGSGRSTTKWRRGLPNLAQWTTPN